MSIKGIFVVMTFSVMAWESLGLKWTTEALHTNCCEGEDKILMWNYSLEANETVQDIQWYFNQSTQIAYLSGSGKFHVHDLYKSRLEQIGRMGILLKNVSSVDTGNYGVYLNLGPDPPENMQTIFLTVFESPTYQCKPNITKFSENVLFCSTKSCGGIKLSTEWRISGNDDFVINASYLEINSSWNDANTYCCLHIKNMQCHNGNLLDFCASTIIAEDKHAPDSKYREHSVNLTAAVIVLATITFLSVVFVISYCYREKICKSCAMQCNDTNKERERNMEGEDSPMMEDAMQCNDTNMERERNMKGEDHPMMRGAMQIKITKYELEHKNECGDPAMMEGARQCNDTNMERERNMDGEDRPMMRGATHLKVTEFELEHKNECGDRPMMEGAMQLKVTQFELEHKNEGGDCPMMEGSMQLKVTQFELEHKNKCEDHPMMEGRSSDAET